MGVMTFGNGTGGGFHFREVKVRYGSKCGSRGSQEGAAIPAGGVGGDGGGGRAVLIQ